MTAQEIELWVRDVVSAVRQGQPVEESRIELKSSWIAWQAVSDCGSPLKAAYAALSKFLK